MVKYTPHGALKMGGSTIRITRATKTRTPSRRAAPLQPVPISRITRSTYLLISSGSEIEAAPPVVHRLPRPVGRPRTRGPPSTEKRPVGRPPAPPENKYCADCKRKFLNTSNYYTHLREFHHEGPKIRCSYPGCGFESCSKKITKTHELTHLDRNDKVYWRCPICRKGFGRAADVRRHFTRYEACNKGLLPKKIVPEKDTSDEDEDENGAPPSDN